MKIAKNNGGPEIFYSIQGEGKNLGRPSVFVRTSLCNLHCVWCDTDFTWNWQGTAFEHQRDGEESYEKFDKREQIAEMMTGEVVATVRKFPCTNVVLTGGEPMLYQDDLVAVMRQLREADERYWFEVETNGTFLPTDEFGELIHQFNISPKTANSKVDTQLREKPDVLSFFSDNLKSVFKFVVADHDDLAEILKLVATYNLAAPRVYLMAEGSSSEQLRERQQWLVEVCVKHGFNFSDRLHIHLWGSRRGV